MLGGYGYLQALTSAIESWSAAVAEARPKTFLWRGADLRHAAERSVFFELVHNAGLRQSFSEHGAVSVAVAPVSSGRRWLYEAANLSRLFRKPVVMRDAEDADILFLVIHPKFVTFFEPIVQRLGRRAAFLTILDPATESYLAATAFPFLSVRLAFSPYRVPKGILSHFLPLTRAYDLMFRFFSRHKKRLVVVPEGNAPIYEIAHRAGLAHGVSTICVQHGAPAYTNPGFRNWTFENVLVWGTQFIEPFAKYNPGQRFTAVGTPAVFGSPRPRQAERIQVIGFFLQKAGEMIPTQEWEDTIRLIRWVADTFPDVTVVIREHPTQPRFDAHELATLGSPPNMRFMSPPEFKLDEVLGICDLVVAAASTTLLEALVTGAVPLIFGTAYPAEFPRLAEKGAAIAAPTFEEAKQAIARLVEDAQWRSQLRAEGSRRRPELFASCGQDGAARIAEFLERASAHPEGMMEKT